MIRLFKYENYEVTVAPEILKISVFKKIWDRDKSKDKHNANMDFAFIYFYCDPRSEYQYLIDDDERMKAVMQGVGSPASWKPDKDLQAAMNYYISFLPPSALLLQDTVALVEKLRKKLRDIDPDDTKSMKEAFSILESLPKVIKNLNETEKAVYEEMNEAGEARGSMEKTLFDDGLDDV